MACLGPASPIEQGVIRALAHRYPADEPGQVSAVWNDDYAGAMREVYRAHSDDLDVASLFAEAIMNRTPWQLWDLKSDGPEEGADTPEAIPGLGPGQAPPRGRHHPGLVPKYIYLMETATQPERAQRH